MASHSNQRAAYLWALFGVLFGIQAPAFGVGAITIEMRESAMTDEAIVTLGDVALITADSHSALTLSQLDLDEFDENGVVRVSQNLARVRTKLAGFQNVRWAGATHCDVRRAKIEPFAVRVFDEMQREYARALQAPLSDIKIKELQTITPPNADRLSRFTIVLPTRPTLGAQRCKVHAVSRRGVKQTLSVLHEVSVKRDFPVTTHGVQRGELIEAGDYHWEPRYSTDNNKPLTALDIEGKTVGSAVPAGTELQPQMLLDPRKVKIVMPRQRVVCVAKVGSITVTMPDGVAVSAGARGETIRMRNPVSGKDFVAVVLSPTRVQVLR